MSTSLLAIIASDGHTATTTSLAIAEKFGKRHKNVLNAIRNLECSEAFRGLNFKPTFYTVPGPNNSARREEMYEITRDGFAFLAMGFTGQEAAAWKEKFLEAFNQLETAWRSSSLAMLLIRDRAIRQQASSLSEMQQAYVRGLLGGGRIMCENAVALAEDYLRNPSPFPALFNQEPNFRRNRKRKTSRS